MNSSCRSSTAVHNFEAFSFRLLAGQLVALVLVISLALLSFGPMLDHHFAERHPGHHHLFLGAAESVHIHDFQPAHVHDSTWMYAQPDATGSGTGQVVYLIPSDGAGFGSADLTVRVVMQSVRLSTDDENAVIGAADKAGGVLTGTSIAPPTRPPRA